MVNEFKRIGLFAKCNSQDMQNNFKHVINFLKNRGHFLIIEQNSAAMLNVTNEHTLPAEAIGKSSDLIIVVGGDGSLLKAARSIVDTHTPILGINRGRLGFLADIHPEQLESTLTPILQGHYVEEKRCLLQAKVLRHNQIIASHSALNDVVLYSGGLARMIEFEIFIDDQLVLTQRSDGIITATPTGSTAYALSGGGPILYPTLHALTLVPMFPHTLSARPIVISDQKKIKLIITPSNEVEARLSCDGQYHITLHSKDEIFLEIHPNKLRLLHPKGYNYFAVLRKKLGWHAQITTER